MHACHRSARLFAILGLLFLSAKAAADVRHDIDARSLESHVRTLASDNYAGRGAGYDGEAAAATYIAKALEDAGLAPVGDQHDGTRSYSQAFEFHPRDPEKPWQVLHTRNVVAVLPGSDLADEIIVLGAHHDGQGAAGQANAGRFQSDSAVEIADNIWNSASDNATSIAVLLEVARVLAANDRPLRRTLLFVTFSAEEYSLNGAVHYVSNPPLNWQRHVAMINLEKLVGDPDIEFITATTDSSPAFDDIAKRAAQQSGVPITAFFPGLVTDTDHYPFVARGVPAMVIGTGSYQHIHESGDEADRLDYALLQTRGRFVLEFLVAAANHPGSYEFTADTSGLFGVLGSPPSAAELAERRVDNDIATLKVSAVIPGMRGALSGLQPGDLIIAINDESRPRGDDGFFSLADMTDGVVNGAFEITVAREHATVTLRVEE